MYTNYEYTLINKIAARDVSHNVSIISEKNVFFKSDVLYDVGRLKKSYLCPAGFWAEHALNLRDFIRHIELDALVLWK